MADVNDLVKLAVDAYHGKVQNYSLEQSQEVLRKSLIEANNGKEYVDPRDIRDGKCNGLFRLLETLLSRTVIEGLQDTDPFMGFCDIRNLALGDKNIFYTEESFLYRVDEVASGTQGIRRQRVGRRTEFSVGVKSKAVKIYEEADRVLAGRVSWNDMVSNVATSFREDLLNEIYTLWAGATAADFGGETYFPTAGSFSEDALLDLIAHVEAAASGKTATISGTKKALRKLMPSIKDINSSDANNDIYHQGIIGSWFGTPVIATPQRHKVNSTEFVFPDDILTITATDDKFIHVVYEGNPIINAPASLDMADLSYQYVYIEKYGVALTMPYNGGIGRYQITE